MSSLVFRISAILGSLAVIGIIIWVDLTTSIWQDYAVISGLAGGLVTFLLTAVVVDKIIARSTHERWAPITRLALGDLRRSLAADSRNSAAGMRRLPEADATGAGLDALITAAADERDAIASALERWSSFLAASADVVDVMDEIAELAERLDAIDAEATRIRGRLGIEQEDISRLREEVDGYHVAGEALFGHLDSALSAYQFPRTLSLRRPQQSRTQRILAQEIQR